MNRTWIVAGAVAGVVALGALAFNLTGTATVSRSITLRDVRECQVGGAQLTVVFDGTDRLEIETTRRSMPFVMVRQTGGLLELGWPDDSDLRMFLPRTGSDDPLRLTLHTSSLERLTAAGGAEVLVDRLETDRFTLIALSERTCNLRGVDVGHLAIEMAGGEGDVIAEGRADSLYLMNSGTGDFDGSRLIAEKTDTRLSGPGTSSIAGPSGVETLTAP